METMDSQTRAATETSRFAGLLALTTLVAPLALYLVYVSAHFVLLNNALYSLRWAGPLSSIAGSAMGVFVVRRGYWSSRTEQVLFYSLITLPILWASLLALNAWADTSEPMGELTYIVQKDTQCWFRNLLGCTYSLEVSSWQKAHTVIRLQVKKEAFSQLEPDQPVIVVTHKGWLGITWAKDIKTLEPWQLRAIISEH